MSVLVSVDRHEWYAPPQIYTRDDSSGLWTVKPTFQPESMMPSSGLNGEASHLEHRHQINRHELIDGVSSMETCYEHASAELHSENEAGIGSKKRLEEDMSSDGAVADGLVNETGELKLENKTSMENPLLSDCPGPTAAAANASIAERVIEPTLVMFEVHVPPSGMLDGVHSQHFFGTAVIIHHSRNIGLVAVDKNTVAISLSNVMLSFAAYPIEIPGEVVFLHPVHNYALVAYDPLALGPVGASVDRAAELLPGRPAVSMVNWMVQLFIEPELMELFQTKPALCRGDSVYHVGLCRSLLATSRKSIVTNPCPRYKATNMEVIELDTDFGSTFSGLLTDEHGRGFHFPLGLKNIKGEKKLKFDCNTSEDHQFVRGIPVYAMSQVLDKIIAGANGLPLLINGVKRPMPLVRILEVEFYTTLLSKARSFGLLLRKIPVRRQVLRVKENACQALDNGNNDGNLNMTIFRQDFDDVSKEETDHACNDFDIGQYPNFDDETVAAEEDVVDDNEEEVTTVNEHVEHPFWGRQSVVCPTVGLLSQFKAKNHGSVTHIKTDRDGRFELLFITIGAAIRSFITCMRPVIIVDGAHLKGRYHGVNLLAVAMDANNVILPIAYGVGKSETSDSWTWFMGHLRDYIGPISNLTVISDRANSIDNAVRRCFPYVFHGLCGVYLYRNLKSRSTGTLKHRVTPWTEKKITKRVVKSTSWRVEPCSNTLFEVLDNNLNGLVDLNAKTCSCKKWKTSGYPCGHVIKVALHLNQDDSSPYAMDCYTTEVYRQTYAEIVYPIPHPSEWDIPDDL
ncbi:Protease Do-like 7 [Hibiscus syriacus]|uniref:Protease Do-like 7 n=1 Tax=Hibiscus syriacus TaxID=106335 RepID=A0A6A2XM07_HIBSY|nr:Protease Do-like 7 [Hibiscus syriacus]